jgi:hypothetical protein
MDERTTVAKYSPNTHTPLGAASGRKSQHACEHVEIYIDDRHDLELLGRTPNSL